MTTDTTDAVTRVTSDITMATAPSCGKHHHSNGTVTCELTTPVALPRQEATLGGGGLKICTKFAAATGTWDVFAVNLPEKFSFKN